MYFNVPYLVQLEQISSWDDLFCVLLVYEPPTFQYIAAATSEVCKIQHPESTVRSTNSTALVWTTN